MASKKPPPLTPAQKAWVTRRANIAAKAEHEAKEAARPRRSASVPPPAPPLVERESHKR